MPTKKILSQSGHPPPPPSSAPHTPIATQALSSTSAQDTVGSLSLRCVRKAQAHPRDRLASSWKLNHYSNVLHPLEPNCLCITPRSPVFPVATHERLHLSAFCCIALVLASLNGRRTAAPLAWLESSVQALHHRPPLGVQAGPHVLSHDLTGGNGGRTSRSGRDQARVLSAGGFGGCTPAQVLQRP